MAHDLILVVGGGLVGFLLGLAAMLLFRERPSSGRAWDSEAGRFSSAPEDMGRTNRQGASEDTHNQQQIPPSLATPTGRTPIHVTTRGGAPVAMLTAVGDGRSWLLRYSASTTIGRFDDCDIAVDDHGVSRLHAQITHRTDTATAHEFAIFDYSSTNGTMVNGLPINAVASLQDGDHIHIGNTEFIFRRVRQGQD